MYKPVQKKPLMIGISGGTCSGKSMLTEYITNKFSGRVTVVCGDNFYKELIKLVENTDKKIEEINFDCPKAFDLKLMYEKALLLKNGVNVTIPIYDYKTHSRVDSKKVIASDIIIFEGIIIFHKKEMRDLFDLMIYVDADSDIRLLRRQKRDKKSRGRSLESINEQWMSTVRDSHNKYIEPTKKLAHIVLNNNIYHSSKEEQQMIQFQLIISYCKDYLS